MNGFQSAFGNFTKSLQEGIGQVKQLTGDKLVQVDPDCVCELPPEYLAKEQKLEQVKSLYETMLRLYRPLTLTDYDPSVGENLKDIYSKMSEAFGQLKPPASQQQQAAESPITSSPVRASQFSSTGGNGSSAQEEIPKTLAHAISKASHQHGVLLGQEDPLGAALKRFAEAQDEIGFTRLKLEEEVANKFMQPFSATLNTNIQFAIKAKKQLWSAKQHFEVTKTRFKNAPTPQVQADMEKAELTFNDALKDAQYKVKLVVGSPETIRNLVDLISALIQYHKQNYDILTNLHTDVEEFQITQEALYRSE
ncbi:hypothetical protein MP228_011704 [Amoeboaphelidium protococcarum]|nr:hypothetical protein MP228_011704 [Amoeboaphelidium protococcarum]